jgi:hypothetical protein
MQYTFFNDPGHGWLEVSIEELLRLNLTQHISQYSYINSKKNLVYLEEDCDAPKFLQAKKKLNEKVEIMEEYSNEDSNIRRMNRFNLFAF